MRRRQVPLLLDGRVAEMRAMYETEKLSLADIARRVGGATSTVRARLLEAGVVLRTRVEGMTMAKRAGRGISPLIGKYIRTPEILAKLSASKRALPARGTSLKPSGYVEITRGPHKSRGEHRVVMEMLLGRKLAANETVHHRDHNRANNAADNLVVMTRSEHARLHALERIANGERLEAHFKGASHGKR